jgi:CRP-like cAMP-binding protein
MNALQIVDILEKKNLVDKILSIKRDDFLKQKGTIDTNIYFIVSGSLKVFVADNEEEQIIRFGYQNNILVSLDSFLSGKSSDFYIQALKKTTVKIISKENFMQFVNQDMYTLRVWTKILEELVLQQMEREKDILTASPRERYHRVLKRSPQLFQEISNKHIANYLRMSPETLSRLKKS